MCHQEMALCRVFHPFGDHAQAKVMRQGNGRGADGDIVGVGLDVADKGLVELQGVNW